MAGVNVKMGVSGVAEFKRSMKESQTAVKTLDQELKKSEAQYKATGDKEKYMADQSKLLKQKLEEQKRTAKEAEKALDAMRKQGVEQTSTAYQEMSRQLAKAQTDIYNTQVAMNGLSASETQAAQSASTLGNNIAGISKKVSLQNISTGLQNISGMLEQAAGYALQVGKNIVSSIKDAAQYADDTATLAQVYEIPLERLLQMQALVDAGLDTSVDAMVSAMSKMKRGVGKESTEAMNYLKQFGLVATIAGGKTGETFDQLLINDPDELFWKAGQGIMAMADAYEKETAAQAIFGRSWRELIPLFTAYKDQESFSKALESTNINSTDTIENMAELNDKFGELEHNFEVVKVELLNTLSPALTQVSDIISGVLKEFNEYLQTEEGQQKMQELSDAVTSLFEGLKDIKPGDVIDTAKDILTGIVDALKWISNNWTTVETGIKAIGVAWGAIKVTEGVTTFLTLIDGIKGLGTGGAAAGAEAGEAWGTSFGAAVMKAVPWLAGLLVFTRGIWDDTYTGNSEDADFYRGILESQYEGDVTDEAVEAYGKLAELNVEIEKINEAMELYGLTVKEATKQQQEEVNEKQTRVEELRKAGLYEASWLIGGDKTSYNRLQEYWDLYRTGEATNKDWQDLVSYFTEGKNRNGYDQTSLMRVLNRMYGLDRNMEDLPNEVFGLDAELNLTDDAQENLQKQANGLQPVSVPGVINLHHEDEGDGGSHGFANGLPFVPYDGYPAILHKGERVLTAGANRNYTYNSNTYFGNVNLNNGMEIDALSESIARQNRRHNAGYGT